MEFKDLEPGSKFIYQDCVCLKLRNVIPYDVSPGCTQYINAVSLVGGEARCIPDSAQVVCLDK